MTIDLLSSPAWALAPGAVGGLLNALLTNNLNLRPRMVPLGAASAIACAGILANVALGALAALALFAALPAGSCSATDRSIGSLALVGLAAVCTGLATARLLTNACDKRLLRAAACKASAAPAAHPDAVQAIETGSPYDAFTAAEKLMPQRTSFRRREH